VDLKGGENRGGKNRGGDENNQSLSREKGGEKSNQIWPWDPFGPEEKRERVR